MNFVLRRPRVASFADIIKLAAIFNKATCKDSTKIKELDIMYQNIIDICIS